MVNGNNATLVEVWVEGFGTVVQYSIPMHIGRHMYAGISSHCIQFRRD